MTVFCEESADGVEDPIRSAVSLSEDVQVIECLEHPPFEDHTPSPEQSCPEISSEHAMTFQDVGYKVMGFNKCHWTTKTILSNVR